MTDISFLSLPAFSSFCHFCYLFFVEGTKNLLCKCLENSLFAVYILILKVNIVIISEDSLCYTFIIFLLTYTSISYLFTFIFQCHSQPVMIALILKVNKWSLTLNTNQRVCVSVCLCYLLIFSFSL